MSRGAQDCMPRRPLVKGEDRLAADLFSHPWLPNNGYWDDDGFKYQSCHRCGINMRLKLTKKRGGTATYDKTEHREFCRDCKHPAFLRPFDDDFRSGLMAQEVA